MSSNPWRTKLSGAPSQFSLDLFQQWKAEQDREIANRGQDKDHIVEEEHIRFMIRQNLNGYVCYRELDNYTACLDERHLINRDLSSGTFEVNTKNKANEKLCRPTHNAYVGCMGSQKNQELVMENAVIEPHCTVQRDKLFECLRENKEGETKSAEPTCGRKYQEVLWCGLNHMWNRYWRSIARFGDAEEYQLYELSRDENKRQDYLRFVTTTEEQHQTFLKNRSEMEKGYYIVPPDLDGMEKREDRSRR